MNDQPTSVRETYTGKDCVPTGRTDLMRTRVGVRMRGTLQLCAVQLSGLHFPRTDGLHDAGEERRDLLRDARQFLADLRQLCLNAG